ncbi:MAG: PAS domain S-box protein [Candidatus Omnitrophota bacterium]
MLNTVKVPKQFEPMFAKAQEYVSKYFKQKKEDPSKGTIEIFGQRYILIRAASMSVDFFDTVKSLYSDYSENEAIDVARQFLFDIAHVIGKQDAKNFHEKMKLKDPIEKLSAGPVHFSHTGWAFVDIFAESKPSPDENYYLIYDHPFSFESDAWLKAGKKTDFPVCVMNAGYSSGWCEESFGISLVASEIMCKAKGDEACRFIMAPPARIEEHINSYLKKEPKLAKKITNYNIPGFFKRKELEQQLQQEKNTMQNYLDIAGVMLVAIGANEQVTLINKKGCDILGYEKGEVIGKNWFDNFLPEAAKDVARAVFRKLLSGETESVAYHENPILTRTGDEKMVAWHNTVLKDEKGNIIGTLSSGEDITERKKTEMELKKRLHELEVFNKVSVDREERILELKKEIERLKTDSARKQGEKA